MAEQKPKAAEQVAVWQPQAVERTLQSPQQKQAGVWKPQMAGLTLQSPQQRQVQNQTVWKPLAEVELAGAA